MESTVDKGRIKCLGKVICGGEKTLKELEEKTISWQHDSLNTRFLKEDGDQLFPVIQEA